MTNKSIRYGTRFGCKWGQPHDLARVGESPRQIWEQCKICNKKIHWNKGYKGRVENAEYLKAHVRQYAQDFGSTKRVYYKIYHPEKAKIIINI